MTDTTTKPSRETTRSLKFYNNSGVAIPANRVLVPDTTNDRSAKLPATNAVVTEITGVSYRAIAIGAEADVDGIFGDTTIVMVVGQVNIGDRLYVRTDAGNEGKVSTFVGSATTGSQYILGTALDVAADGSLVAVRLAPKRVGEGRKFGTATLVAGSVTVSGVSLVAGAKIQLTMNTAGGTPGFLSAPAASRNVGASTFLIQSSSGTDTSTVDWEVISD